MGAVDEVGARVHTGVGQVHVRLLGMIDHLVRTKVEHADDILRAVLLELFDGGGAVLHGGEVAVIIAVDAHVDAVGRGEDLGLLLHPVGDAAGVQRRTGILHTLQTEVHGVVVGGGDEVHAAFRQDLGKFRGCAEIEAGVGVEPGVGEGAFQIGDGQLVVLKILLRVVEGVGKVPVHLSGVGGLVALGKVLVGGQGAVADGGEGEVLRRGLRRGRGSGPVRPGGILRRGVRQGRLLRHGRGTLRRFLRGGLRVSLARIKDVHPHQGGQDQGGQKNDQDQKL